MLGIGLSLTRAALPGGKLFSDDFERADTTDGNIGNGWVLKAPYAGSYPLQASPYGRITSGRFVADAGEIVYAQRNATTTVRRIRAVASWVVNPAFNPGNTVTGAATIALLVSGDANLVNDMGLHATVARAGNGVFQKRVAGGAFVTLGTITNAQMQLKNDGTPFSIEAWASSDGNWGLTVNGFTITGSDPDVSAHLSSLWACEIYQNGVNHVDLVRIDSITALKS